MCAACQTGYQEIRNLFSHAKMRAEISKTIRTFSQDAHALPWPLHLLFCFHTPLGYPLLASECTCFLNDPKVKKKIHSYNYIKQKILFYQDRFIDRMIQVTVYLQLNLFIIFSAHITLFFRTVVNTFIDDQFLDRNLCIPPFYSETIRKRTFLYDLWDF